MRRVHRVGNPGSVLSRSAQENPRYSRERTLTFFSRAIYLLARSLSAMVIRMKKGERARDGGTKKKKHPMAVVVMGRDL